MKKFISVLLFLFLSVNMSFAKDYSLKFNGDKYNLLYSVKNKDFGGYLNEYYKRGETYNIWSEMVAIHHFPNAYSPIDRIKDFRNFLTEMNCPSSLTFDDKKNSAIIDFIMIYDKKLPLILEFNVFKYEKSKKSGSVAVQYVIRYSATTTMQAEAIKKEFEKNRKRILKKIKKFKLPPVITEDIDKCKVDYVYETEDDNKQIKDAENINSESDEKEVSEETLSAENQEIKDEEKDNTAEENEITNETTNTEEKEAVNDEINDEINILNVSEKENENSENSSHVEEEVNEEVNTSSQDDESETPAAPEVEEQTTENYVSAPVPDAVQENTEKTLQNKDEKIKNKKSKKQKVKKEKVKKEKSYQVINTKDEYYSPKKVRTVKKVKEKPYKVINTKDEYYTKKVKYRKVTKKEAKNRVKNAEKNLAL